MVPIKDFQVMKLGLEQAFGLRHQMILKRKQMDQPKWLGDSIVQLAR